MEQILPSARFNELDKKLFDAVAEYDVAWIKDLLEKGANVNINNEFGMTPLHLAVWLRNADVSEILISYGADVNARDMGGFTPLHYAVHQHDAELVRLLLNSGADPTLGNNFGDTPLDFARRHGLTDIAKLIEEFSRKPARAAIKKAHGSENLTNTRDGIIKLRSWGVGRARTVKSVDSSRGVGCAVVTCPYCGKPTYRLGTLDRYYCFNCKRYV